MSVLERLVVSAAKRFKTPIGKAFVKTVDYIQAATGRRMGEFDQELKDAGLFTLSRLQRDLVRPALEGKTVTDPVVNSVASKLRQVLDKVHGEWTAKGGMVREVRWVNNPKTGALVREVEVRPTGYLESYFPHQLKSNVAEILFEDANAVFNEAQKSGVNISALGRGEIPKFDDVSAQILEDMVRKRMAITDGFQQETNEALTYMLGRDPNMTPGQALRILHNRAQRDLFNPMGSLERARVAHLPSHFYESDPIKVLRRYGHGWARRTSEADVWGMDYRNLLEMMNAAPRSEAKEMERLAGFITGAGEHIISREMRKLAMLFTEFEVTTKIGLGTAVIPNISQPTISIIPKAGIYRVLRGTARLFTAEGRKAVRQSGVLSRGYTAMQVFSGNWRDALSLRHLDLEGLRWYEKLSRISTVVATTPFNYVNRMLNIVSAATGEVYIKDLIKIARRGGMRGEWAAKQLSVLNINPLEELTNAKRLEGMYRFAIDSQLQRDVLRDPIWMNDPRFRFLSLFKRFGYRQFTYVKDRLIKDELSRGNILPLLRLGVGGFAGGEFVIWSKNAIRRELFKAPDLWTEQDNNIFAKFLDAMVAVGSLGVFSDIARLKGEDFASALDQAVGNGFFAIAPLAVTEVTGLPGSYTRSGWPQWARRFMVETIKEDVPTAWVKGRKSALSQLTPLGGMLAAAIREKERKARLFKKAFKQQ